MDLVTEMLLVSGVALDLVGAGVLSHAHNAESIVELREDIGEEGARLARLGSASRRRDQDRMHNRDHYKRPSQRPFGEATKGSSFLAAIWQQTRDTRDRRRIRRIKARPAGFLGLALIGAAVTHRRRSL